MGVAAAIALVAALSAVAWWLAHVYLLPRGGGVARASGSMAQGVYVWQRDWRGGIAQSLALDWPGASQAVFLAGEISVHGGRVEVHVVEPDWGAIRRFVAGDGGANHAPRSLGIAIRIGSCPQAQADAMWARTGELLRQLADKWGRAGLTPAEIQIDYDCPQRRLADYAARIRTLRPLVRDGKLVITALPSWLSEWAMAELAAAADGFVLQVHSVDRPLAESPLTLCDTAAARRWAERAASFGRDFRLALPTYTYLAVFGRDGRFVTFLAEGPQATLQPGSSVRRTEADPAQLAELVRQLTADRPAHLQGLIWYRLPSPSDRLNWPRATLLAVMAGRTPQPRLHARAVKAEHAIDIVLTNTGDAAAPLPKRVVVTWPRGRKTFAEALGDYRLAEDGATNIGFLLARPDHDDPAGRTQTALAPGSSLTLGWLVLDTDTEVRTHVED